jgi:arginyl-tRNA synthetase
MRKLLRAILSRAIREVLGKGRFPEFKVSEILIERPDDPSHGDYATTVALQIAKETRMKPMEIAEMVTSKIVEQKPQMLDRVEIAKPGFINFFLSNEYLQKLVGEIFKKHDTFGKLHIGRGKSVNIEFISANPTGPLHIGNGRNAFVGDVLANILEWAGYQVTREYYVNDAKHSNQIRELGKTALGKGTAYLTENLKAYIGRLKAETQISKLTENEVGYKLAKMIQNDTRNFIERKLKIKIDKWVFEEDLYRRGKITKIFTWLKKKNFVYQKEGAWWLKTSEFGDERDWVLIRKNGQPTYFLSDIAYHKDKFDRGFQKIIDIWGADHQAHVSKIKAAAKLLGYKGELDVLILQLVSLKGGEKLSKRKGEVIQLEELVDEIGLDGTRFFYLQRSIDTHMDFDVELAKERSQKNPMYYVQYAHARICSILRKFNMENKKFPMKPQDGKLLTHPSEFALIKQLIRLPEVIEDTARDYQVQRLPQYAVDLATAFHQFYRDCRVVSENKQLTRARLVLIFAAKIVLKNTLSIMGISAPERM